MSRSFSLRTLAIAGLAAIPAAFAFFGTRTTAQPPVSLATSAGTASAAQGKTTTNVYTTLSATSGATTAAAALTPAQAGADPYFVEPRVPRAAGTPCVDTLVRDQIFNEPDSSPPSFSWTPSGACPGPWAKIVLVVETSGPRDISAAVMRVQFDNTYEGGGAGGSG